MPILLYIGLLIGAQAFQVTPRAHAAAVVAALIPNIAAWATGQMDNVLAAAGTSAAEVGNEALEGAGVVYARPAGARPGRDPGRSGARRDRRVHHRQAVRRTRRSSPLSGAVLSFIGLIHGEKVEWNANGQVALGYLFVAVVCGLFALTRVPPREPDADEIELDRLHGGPAAPPADAPVSPAVPSAAAAQLR